MNNIKEKYKLNENISDDILKQAGFRNYTYRTKLYKDLIVLIITVDLSDDEKWWTYQVCNTDKNTTLYIPYYNRAIGTNELVEKLDKKIENIFKDLVKESVFTKVKKWRGDTINKKGKIFLGTYFIIFFFIFGCFEFTYNSNDNINEQEQLNTASLSNDKNIKENTNINNKTVEIDDKQISTQAEDVIVEESFETVPETTGEEYIIENTLEQQEEQSGVTSNNYVGIYSITAYTWTGYTMANGEYPYVGCAASCDFPLGTIINVEGIGTYVVKDVCPTSGVVDLYMNTYDECIAFGRRNASVYIVNWKDGIIWKE